MGRWIRGADSTYVVRWQVWFGHVSGYVWTLFMFLLGRVEIWRMIRLMLLSRDEMDGMMIGRSVARVLQ